MVWPLLVAVPHAAATPLVGPAIAGGLDHSLVIGAGGTVWAAGANQFGQLGDGTTNDSASPVQVFASVGITAIAAGRYHSLALRPNGTVQVWGRNNYGQLGDGTTTDRSTPVQVSGLTGITAIAAGDSYSLALKSDGTVWAWGENLYGQLGDGTTTDRSTPVQVSGLTGITAVTAGTNHALAFRADGTVWAWGLNSGGRLGDGTTTNRTTPVQVSALTGITAIAAGGSLSLALKTDGTVWAWGWNNYGQLGDGTTTNRSTPVQVNGLTGITAIAAGVYYSLALKSDGTVQAWGVNWSGQLGDGTYTNRSTPVQVSGLTGITGIAGGIEHSLALKADGTVWAWGRNYYGQLGDGTTTSRTTPVMSDFVAGPGVPPVPPVDDPLPPPAPGGVAAPSEDCEGGTNVVDGYGGGSYVRVRVHQPDPSTLWVCVRADGASVGHGGRFTLSTAGTALPNTPTTDTDWEACTVTPGDIDALPDPVYDATIAGNVHVRFDAYQSTTEFWTCVKVGNEARYRVKVPLAPGGGTPTVTFLPDPPDAGPPVPSDSPVYASGDCARASSGTRTEWLNGDIANSHVWLSSWAESTSRGHVCVRLEGGGSVGGKLTLDTTLNPGISPVVGSTTSAGKPTECSQPLYEQASPSELRLFVTPAGANPAGVCIKRDGVDWQMIRLGASGSPNVSMPVAWTPDPGTPG